MWQVDHQCPQCGASANLQETERLFACPFCRVKLYIAPSGACRYFLPPSAADADETIFVPYWRFKGMYFYFVGADFEAGIIDVSHNATPLDMLPSSLGLRSQTLKIKFLSPEIKGSFLEPACSLQDALSTVEKSSEPNVPSFSERTFIGDSAGMIYSPICIRKNTAYDGILGKEIAALPDAVRRELAGEHKKPQWRIAFIPSLCPDCGWDLNGEPESVVLTCRNCLSAWGAAESGFEKVPCSFLSMRGDDL
ncbi:MAG: hypothetical protein PHN75_19840, partial [Syntrophales bacterium]|nr:hypothetical protein [Syntrophales bacterium]